MLPVSIEDQLLDLVDSTFWSVERWVDVMYPWGEAGTFLEGRDGPEVWQRKCLQVIDEQLGRIARGEHSDNTVRIAASGGHGTGKVLSNTSTVPTPDRGVVSWGDIGEGDRLFGADGRPVTVVAKYPHEDWPFYRVTFDDRSSVLAGPEHLWAVRGRNARRKGRSEWEILSTQQLIERGIKRRNGVVLARQWEIPTQGAAQFDEREINIHPYLVGLWLGDGKVGEPMWSKPFRELTEKVRSLGYRVSVSCNGQSNRVLGQKHLWSEPWQKLKSHERYIPADYRFNTVENRRALLEGLLDSDGEVNGGSGSIGYSTTSERLAHDVVWLVRSLGGKATLQPTEKKAWYPNAAGKRVPCRKCFRLSININWNPFTLNHRRRAYKPSQPRYRTRWIESIEFDHVGSGHCVTVDAPDHLYQAQDFIVTHNTVVMAWVIQWFMSTRPSPQAVITAGTQNQLKSKTWREVKKWLDVCLVGHWFEWSLTSMQLKDTPTWKANALAWSESHPHNFAGTHERYVLYIFDEASLISSAIWETSEGAFTTEGPHIWLAFGNPENPTGRFRDCWGIRRKYWTTFEIDARDTTLANKALIEQWKEQYGEDSDFFRVRVKGQPPRTGPQQLISTDEVERAEERFRAEYKTISIPRQIPKVMGVDPAGGDSEHSAQTVMVLRQGMLLHPDIIALREPDGMKLASLIAHQINVWQPDVAYFDAHGLGKPIYDRLVQMGYGHIVIPVYAGQKDCLTGNDVKIYFNNRILWWSRMKAWLPGAMIPQVGQLREDMLSPRRYYNLSMQMLLESKDDMASRGVASPDFGDAVAQTFAQPVPMMIGEEGGSMEPDA